MKKKIALIGALGAAGGLIYALESQRRKKQAAKAGNETDNQPSLSESSSGTSSVNPQPGDNQIESAASMAKIENGRPVSGGENEHVIDDHGTDQSQASEILRSIRDQAFDASDERLALALGRSAEEISEWTGGGGLVDGDVLMKARALAMQRGFEV